jgi:hypothetical protein
MDIERIRAKIAEIATRPKHVHFDEIVGLLDNHIKNICGSYNHHGNPHHAFTVGQETFNIAKPHKGFVKKVYVTRFLEAMEALGLYERRGD